MGKFMSYNSILICVVTWLELKTYFDSQSELNIVTVSSLDQQSGSVTWRQRSKARGKTRLF